MTCVNNLGDGQSVRLRGNLPTALGVQAPCVVMIMQCCYRLPVTTVNKFPVARDTTPHVPLITGDAERVRWVCEWEGGGDSRAKRCND